jgi:TetR/AcrR family transcriptional regulator
MAAPRGTTARREQRRALHHDLSRTQLLDAAEVVFGDKGMHASTIKEIAELADYSVGSVYSYFTSKDDLLIEVLARRGREMASGVERVVGGPGTPLQRLVHLARYEVEFFVERPAFARLYLRIAPVGSLVPETVITDEESLDQVMTRTASLVAEGQRQGSICAGPPRLLARVLSGIVTSYQSVLMADGPASLSDFGIDELGALVERTFGVSPEPTTPLQGDPDARR